VEAIARSRWSAALLGLLSVAAAPPVAMRVTVDPVRAAGADTAVAVIVEIAPEDRPRVGPQALLQVELTRPGQAPARIAQTIELGRDGAARIELVWPPGSYQLRVDVEGSAGGRGGWVGAVTVPRLSSAEVATPAPASQVSPEAAAAAAPALAAAPPAALAPDRTVGAGAAPASSVAPSPPAPGPSSADPTLAQLTVTVTERSRPIRGLDRSQLELRVDGKEVPIEALGGAGSAPIQLGLAVDASRAMVEHLPMVSRQLGRVVVRTVGEGGQAFLATADATAQVVVDWGGSAAAIADRLARPGAAEQGDLPGLIRTSLERFQGRRGRKFLIVVTGGGQITTRAGWQDAIAAAETAGFPILVVGLRSDALEERTRRSLDGMAEATGGRSYFLPDPGMLEMTLDYLIDLIASSYTVEFQRPSASTPAKAKLEAASGDLEVSYPRSFR
jgi:hypothetical protein